MEEAVNPTKHFGIGWAPSRKQSSMSFLVAAGTTPAPTAHALNGGPIFNLVGGYSANAGRVEVGFLCLNTAETAQLAIHISIHPNTPIPSCEATRTFLVRDCIGTYFFVSLFLPLCNQVGVRIAVFE